MPHSTIADRLTRLRAEMARARVDFWLVPSSDAHQSEYVPDCWQRRAWVTGFNGSMGNAVIGLDGAWLFADSRYWLQADRELDPNLVSLMRMGDHGVPSLPKFLAEMAANRRVGYDPMLHSPAEAKDLQDALRAAEAELVPLDNLVDLVWTDRPALPDRPVEAWPPQFSGRTVAEKLALIRTGMAQAGADHLVVATLDELAWVFDIRGTDVDFNPIAIAWGLISRDSATLFIDPEKLTDTVRTHLAAAQVDHLHYAAFGDHLLALTGKVFVDRDQANQWILDRIALAPAKAHLGRSPVQLLRARKNPTEQDGMRRAHVRDGVAVVRFLAWLEDHFAGLTEIGAADRLEAFRRENERFRGLSFDTIAGFGPNGAIVHYRASEATNRTLDDRAIFLLDSGAQYLDGTTDITRTVHLGTPTPTEREHYTRVLRGHLALGRTRFPRGTTGTQLDAFARAPLWDVGLNYGHGTGHGVGCFLSVHQGPHRISPAPNDVGLEPGMIVSNEPGFYLTGAYGIRIENLVLVTEVLPATSPFGPFYGFEDLTLVPYCHKLIDPRLLSPAEIAQVDAYHARVREALLPLLDAHPDAAQARAFLMRETAPLA
jgi:Xaa-Pro aminopeptidase